MTRPGNGAAGEYLRNKDITLKPTAKHVLPDKWMEITTESTKLQASDCSNEYHSIGVLPAQGSDKQHDS